MVKFTIALFGFAALCLAAPAPSQPADIEARNDAFSFQEWIDEIAANPEGEHMSAEDAFKAAQKGTRSGKSTHDLVVNVTNQQTVSDPNVLFKRDVSCNQKEKASVADAIVCIDQLAARGSEPCHVAYGGATNLCTHGWAQVVGVANKPGGTTSHCQAVAQAIGAIMDTCWNPDNTVQGQTTAWGNGDMALHLSGKLI